MIAWFYWNDGSFVIREPWDPKKVIRPHGLLLDEWGWWRVLDILIIDGDYHVMYESLWSGWST